GLRGDGPHGALPVRRRVADVVAARALGHGEPVEYRVDHASRLVGGERRLHQVRDLARVNGLQLRHVSGGLDQRGRTRSLAKGALDLLVPAVTDQRHEITVASEPARLGVHLRDQRTGRVYGIQTAPRRLLPDLGRDAVRGEHYSRAVRHFAELVDEDRASLFEAGDHARVVHDLLAHID